MYKSFTRYDVSITWVIFYTYIGMYAKRKEKFCSEGWCSSLGHLMPVFY